MIALELQIRNAKNLHHSFSLHSFTLGAIKDSITLGGFFDLKPRVHGIEIQNRKAGHCADECEQSDYASFVCATMDI